MTVRGFILAGGRTGLVLEAAMPWITPKAFVAILSPILVAGLPILTIVYTQHPSSPQRASFAHTVWRTRWVGATTAVGVRLHRARSRNSLLLDFAGVGITALPIELLVHRLGLLVALELIPVGATRTDVESSGLLAVDLLGWIIELAMPLLGYV